MATPHEQHGPGASRPPIAPEATGETILLVEDEPSVRNLVTRFLTLSAFKVLPAENGPAAASIWARRKNEISLLLTDVVMPGGMNGRALAAQFHAEQPALKVLFTSGYNVESLHAEGSANSAFNFLQKPYRPEQLLAAVRAVLAGTFQVPSESLC